MVRPRLAASVPDFQTHGAALGELHGIIDEILQRRAQPHHIGAEIVRHVVGNHHLGHEILGLGARRQRIRKRHDQLSRIEHFFAQLERAAVGFGGVDHQGRERREMLGAAFDARSPTPLALADRRGRQQFAERQDAGQRCADIVRISDQRGFGRATRRRFRG